MRLAILIRGHLRSWKKCGPILMQQMNQYNCDIFIHSWDVSDEEEQRVIELYKPIIFIKENERDKTNSDLSDIIFSKLTSDSLIAHNINKFKFGYRRLLRTYKCQIYSNYILAEKLQDHMRENKVNYDCILFTRFDIHFNSKVHEAITHICSCKQNTFIYSQRLISQIDTSFIISPDLINIIKNIVLCLNRCKTSYSAALLRCIVKNTIRRERVFFSGICR